MMLQGIEHVKRKSHPLSEHLISIAWGTFQTVYLSYVLPSWLVVYVINGDGAASSLIMSRSFESDSDRSDDTNLRIQQDIGSKTLWLVVRAAYVII